MMSSANTHTICTRYRAMTVRHVHQQPTSLSVAQYDVPRVASSGYRGEYINSLKVNEGLNAGKIVSLLISDKGEFAEMLLFDAGISFRHASYTEDAMFINASEFVQAMKVSGALTSFRGWKELYVEIADPLDRRIKDNQAFKNMCSSSAFYDGEDFAIIISNQPHNSLCRLPDQRQCRQKVEEHHLQVFFERNDGVGKKAQIHRNLRNILQPGEYFIIRSTK